MDYEKCPICGETNYSENNIYQRSFECGFESYHERRTAQCESSTEDRITAKAKPAARESEAARYRLALLDAAQVIDVLAIDMSVANQDARFVERCRELARQIRAFAGHSNDAATFDDRTTRHKAPEKGLLALIQRVKRW